jgi:hypothetical protein
MMEMSADVTTIPTAEPDEAIHPEVRSEETDALAVWLRRLTLLVCGAASSAGAVIAGSFAVRREWSYAAVALILVGWSVLVEGAAGSVRQRGEHPADHPPGKGVVGASVRTVARTANTVFCGFVILAALTLDRGTPAVWPAIAIACSLVSWDLHHFSRRLTSVAHIHEPPTIVQNHLRRLAAVVCAGLFLGLTAAFVRVRYGIGTVVLLSLLSIIGLSRAVAYVRRASD